MNFDTLFVKIDRDLRTVAFFKKVVAYSLLTGWRDNCVTKCTILLSKPEILCKNVLFESEIVNFMHPHC